MRKQFGVLAVLGAAVAVAAGCGDPGGESQNLGNIIIYTATSGVIDSNGYKFTITGKPVITLQANDTGAFQNLKPDTTYRVTISDLKAGCVPAGGTFRDVAVPVGIVEEHFSISCS